jgi:hypothetical protein
VLARWVVGDCAKVEAAAHVALARFRVNKRREFFRVDLQTIVTTITALPATNNLTDQDSFLDNMEQALDQVGIVTQYCMPLPKHYLQSTKYQNLVSTRVSNDRFNRNRWKVFLYGTRLASSLGEWPWSDVFKSSERNNLLLSTLSAGMMGVGDAIGSADKVSIQRAIRSDGVLIKADLPIVQLDRSIVDEARGTVAPTNFHGVLAARRRPRQLRIWLHGQRKRVDVFYPE